MIEIQHASTLNDISSRIVPKAECEVWGVKHDSGPKTILSHPFFPWRLGVSRRHHLHPMLTQRREDAKVGLRNSPAVLAAHSWSMFIDDL
jgi:hypothetical protein